MSRRRWLLLVPALAVRFHPWMLNSRSALIRGLSQMQLFVTCDCSHNTPVTSAKCGQEVQCVCGKSVAVPNFSELCKHSEENQASALNSEDRSSFGQRENAPISGKRRFTFRYSLRLFGLTCLLVALCVASLGIRNQLNSRRVAREVWTVVGEERVLVKLNRHNYDTGTFVGYQQKWGLPVQSEDRQLFLIWFDKPENPFGLSIGDKFRFVADLSAQATFDRSENGYIVQIEHLQMVQE